MKKCDNCPEPVEGPLYKFCKHCWWEQDPRNNDPKQPYLTAKDARKDVTVEMMIEMLLKVPKHYLVRYDSAMGYVCKGDFTIYPSGKISING